MKIYLSNYREYYHQIFLVVIKLVGWVARSKTQHTHQHPRNVGFRGSTQPTLKDLSVNQILVILPI
jgi:hypothetical protein